MDGAGFNRLEGPGWSAQETSQNRWEANMHGHVVVVLFKEHGWMWQAPNNTGAGYFDSASKALLDAYSNLPRIVQDASGDLISLPPSDPRGVHFVDVYIHVVLDVTDPEQAPQIAKVYVRSGDEKKEAELIEPSGYDRSGALYKLLEDDKLNWILGLESVYY